MKRTKVKVIALFLNVLFVHHIVAPTYLYALTGGPSSPEFTGFTPAGASELVNLFSGDFSYNIPLMDVGGYPINLAYNAGIGMEDEASWVGTGWNINPGAINRQVRGLPDDFAGDEVKREYSIKDNHSFGVKAKLKYEFAGFGDEAQGFQELMEKADKLKENAETVKKIVDLTNGADDSEKGELVTGLSGGDDAAETDDGDALVDMKKSFYPFVGFSYNNYRGVGLEVGVTLGSMIERKNGMGHDLSSDLSFGTQNGLGITMSGASASEIMKETDYSTIKGTRSIGGGFTYNSRSGLSSVSFNKEKNVTVSNPWFRYNQSKGGGYDLGFTNPSTSFPQYPTLNFGFTAGVEPGSELYFAKGQTSFKGYYSGQFANGSEHSYRGYGYLHLDKHEIDTDDVLEEVIENFESENYLLDFNREGEKVLSRDVPNLPIPVLTHDVYHASGQGMSMSFRAHRYDNGTVHDPRVRNDGLDGSLELDLGAGNTADVGVDAGLVISMAEKGKWNAGAVTDNFRFRSARELGGAYARPYYFKATSDMALIDQAYYNNLNQGGMLMPELKRNRGLYIKATGDLIDENGFSKSVGDDVAVNLNKPDLQNNIVGLTSLEASSYGLQRRIEYYDVDGNLHTTRREGSDEGYEKSKHHISEFHVTRPDGSHYVYGLPVYNKVAKEVSFSLDKDDTYDCDKLVSYAGFSEDVTVPGHKHGHDRYFNSETTPAYVAAHLITGILSPDYEDLTGNGISDDDHGSAVKFSYTKQSFATAEGSTDFYRYRAPYGEKMAKVNEGLMSDPYDNKASYSYGEKEVYYLHEIESKNFVARFVLNDPLEHERNDAIGVQDEDGGKDVNQRLRRLERIELYSKEDLAKNLTSAVPIKTVHFEYDYSLCTGIPNGEADIDEDGGKLTLKKVWFTYGQSSKGSLSSYKFDYAAFNPSYTENAADNWGSFKKKETSPCNDVTSYPNDVFPYASQLDDNAQTDNVDKWASAWNLQKITLPSGGSVEVNYESDDYGYVQNQDALRMFSIVDTYYDLNEASSLDQNTCRLFEHSGSNKANYTYMVFDLEEALDGSAYTDEGADARVEELYGNLGKGSDGSSLGKLFYKCEVYLNPDKDPDLDGLREFISGYADVEGWGALKSGSTDYNRGYVKLAPIDMNGGKANGGNDEVHPISYESWNFFRKYLNKYVNQISEPKTSGIMGQSSSPIAEGMKVFRELVKSYGQELQRLFQGVNRMMRSQGFAEKIVAGRSMIRLSDPNKAKLGGGHRVASVRISDNWKGLTGSSHDELNGTYGQDYDYTTWNQEIGSRVSSGVAANEPMLGWEECALRQFDEIWKQKKILAAASFTSFERPYGHSFLPGASVGYSTVGVSAFNPASTGTDKIERTATGKTVHEFYTTKDYPNLSKESEIQQAEFIPQYNKGINKAIGKLGGGKFFKYNNSVLGLAQGYLVETNDMNGRQKATHVYSEGAPEFDQQGNRIPGINYSKYHYQVGEVDVMDKDGGVGTRQNIDVDYVIESTRSRSESITPQLQFQAEVALPTAFSGVVPSGAYDKSEVRYIVSTKHVHKRSILTEITSSERGIKNMVTNHRIDPVTGSTALSRTFNEFGDPVYSQNIPGHWAYEELSGKATRQNLLFDKVSLGASNEVLQNGTAISGLKNGDKVILREKRGGYPMEHVMNNDPMLGQKEPVFWYLEGKLIDRTGEVLTLSEVNDEIDGLAYLQIIDPAETNMLGASVGSISSLSEAPIDITSLNSQAKILSASAMEYKDRWRTECCGFQMPFTGYFQYCGDGPCDVVNPFVKGVLGKMRPHKTWAVYGERNSSYTASNEVDVRFDGDIAGFELFWEYDNATKRWKAAASPALWTWTNEITEYDVSGTPLENNNQLNQRTSELLGYDKMLAVAAGQNSRYGEMAFDGFEDYNYKRVPHSSDYLQTAAIHNQCMYEPHFGFTNPEKDYFTYTTESYSHTGLKSLEIDPAVLSGGLSMSFETYDQNEGGTISVPFTMDKGDCFTRFYPEKDQEYSLSLWLREETVQPDGYTHSNVKVSFYDVNETLISQEVLGGTGDLIEGWQRVYEHFTIPSNCESLVVSMHANGSESSFFDDIRLYPKDGAMTSYVYHPHTLRLSATLDANNFASFYEYDAEGGLVRVKKETEEGIVTLQESRKHLIENTTP